MPWCCPTQEAGLVPGSWLAECRGCGGQSVPGLGSLPGLLSLPNPAWSRRLLGETGGDLAGINIDPRLLLLHPRRSRTQRKMKVAVLSVALLLAILCHPADAQVSSPSWAQAEGWGWAAGVPVGQAYFALLDTGVSAQRVILCVGSWVCLIPSLAPLLPATGGCSAP